MSTIKCITLRALTKSRPDHPKLLISYLFAKNSCTIFYQGSVTHFFDCPSHERDRTYQHICHLIYFPFTSVFLIESSLEAATKKK